MKTAAAKYLAIALLAVLTVEVMADQEEPQAGDQVAIATQNQKVYPMPAFYASPAQPVSYGVVVEVSLVQGAWLKVLVPSIGEGWVHRTSVTGAVQMSTGGATYSDEVVTDEVMLAGRGFSDDVEDGYSEEHPELDFTKVDLMESSWKVAPELLYAFLLEGGLIEAVPGQGGEVSGGTGR
jgi:hypothetical protein